MSGLSHIKKKIELNKIKEKTGIIPKNQCPKCKRKTVYRKTDQGCECIRCHHKFIWKEKKEDVDNEKE